MRITLSGLAIAAVLAGSLTAEAQLAPREIIAVLDGTQSFGDTRRAVSFYDVTDLSSGTVFGQTPLFSIWTGYEDSTFANFEDPSSIAVNPVNGDVYLMAYDSGTAGVTDGAGDNEGDYDLYQLDYQAALDDFVTNGRAAGTMYAPALSTDGIANVDHPDHVGSTIFLSGVSDKVGEVGRTQGSSFFDPDLVYFDPATLAYVDNEQDGSDTAAQDHELRIIGRTSTSSGSATPDTSDADSILGGYNNQTSESWETDRIGVLNMDFDTGTGLPIGFSEPEDIVAVDENGVRGVWVAESDGGGDDLSFYPLVGGAGSGVAATATTIDSLGQSRSLDENPEVDTTTNDGDHDFIKVDADGNVIIGESGFFDTVPGGEAGTGGAPAGEPSFQRLNVDSYSSSDVALTAGDAWDDLDSSSDPGFGPKGSDNATDALNGATQLEGPLGSLANSFAGGSGLSLDDDTNVYDGRFSTLDDDGTLWLFDIDSGSLPDVVADVIAIDTNTGEIIYEELNAANHFLIEHGIRHFVRGDTDGDGDVDADDIDAIAAAASGSALEQEAFDLTGDDGITLDTGSTSDLQEIVEVILGTVFGDADLDGDVDGTDFSILSGNFNQAGGWADGDFNGDGAVNGTDFSLLSGNFNFGTSSVAVPEPSAVVLVALSAGLLCGRRRIAG